MLRAVGLILLLVTLPAVLRAAERPSYGRTRLGPVYLTFRAALTAGMDDNVYNSETLSVADQSVSLIPSIEGVVPLTRHARVRATGGLAPHFFASEESERHTDRFGTVAGEIDIGPLSASASRGVGRFRQRFSLEIDERLRREEVFTTYGLAAHVSRVSASATRRILRATYEPGSDTTPVDAVLDRETTTDRFELVLPLSRKTSLAPSVDLIEDRFLHSVAGLSPDVQSERYRLALQFGKLAFISGRVAGGIHRYRAGQGVSPYEGVFLEINAGMPFLLGTRLVLDATRDVTYSIVPAADPTRRNTAVTSVYRGELQFGLPWDMYARVFTALTELDYLSPTLVDGVAANRTDHGWQQGGALLRRLGDYVSAGLQIERSERASLVGGRSYQAWSYGLTAELRY